MKAALYARVSTQDKGQTNDNQLLRLRETAAARGYEITGEYEDHRSGSDAKRPGLDKMLQEARRGKFDLILIVRLDRMGRSLTNLVSLMEDLERWNVKLSCLDQPIDTSTATGRFTLQVLAAAAEFERELIRDRVNDGLARAKAQGKTLGRPTSALSPYQLKKAQEILAAEPDISQRKLAAQFEGISRNTLINGLKEAGLIE